MIQEQQEQEEESIMAKKKFVDEAGYMKVGIRLPATMMRKLRVMAAEEDTTITELLIEGMNDLFAKRESQRVGKKKY
jgi:hypothetical protein